MSTTGKSAAPVLVSHTDRLTRIDKTEASERGSVTSSHTSDGATTTTLVSILGVRLESASSRVTRNYCASCSSPGPRSSVVCLTHCSWWWFPMHLQSVSASERVEGWSKLALAVDQRLFRTVIVVVVVFQRYLQRKPLGYMRRRRRRRKRARERRSYQEGIGEGRSCSRKG